MSACLPLLEQAFRCDLLKAGEWLLRVRNKGVTEPLLVPLLVPTEPEEREGIANFLKGFEGLATPVRRLRKEDFDQKSGAWNSLRREQQERFVNLVKLQNGFRNQDQRAIRESYLRLFTEEPSAQLRHVFDNLPDDHHFSADRLAEALADSMSNLRLVLWRERGKLKPAVFCPDFATAFYLRVLLNVAGNRSFAICPRCGQPFLRRRPDKVYCSSTCGAGARVTKSRRSKKPRSAGNK